MIQLLLMLVVLCTSISCSPLKVVKNENRDGVNYFSFSNNVKKIESAIVQIRKLRDVLGTGFFINEEGYVITANHVVEAGKGEQIYAGVIIENTEDIRGNFSLVEVSVVATDPINDIVILKLNRNPFKGEVSSGIFIDKKGLIPINKISYLKIKKEIPRPGDGVVAVGFPVDSPVVLANFGWVSSIWAYEKGNDIYVLDLMLNPGNSGGPICFVKDNSIIGLGKSFKAGVAQTNSLAFIYNSGLSVAVPATYLIRFLENNKIKYFLQE